MWCPAKHFLVCVCGESSCLVEAEQLLNIPGVHRSLLRRRTWREKEAEQRALPASRVGKVDYTRHGLKKQQQQQQRVS